MKTANQLNSTPIISLSKDNYKKGNTIFGFNFTPDQSHGFAKSNYINSPVHG